jgi:hypothetical protein
MRVLNPVRQLAKRVLPERVVESIRTLINGVGVPGMITEAERAFYTDCSRRLADVDGAIVDLGCWMGATAVALAQGVRGKTGDHAQGPRVYAYDRFVWESWMDNSRPQHPQLHCDYRPGESFLPEARWLVRRYGGPIELIPADLSSYVYQGGPIKLLLVDAMKSKELARSITREFFPSLKEGAILIHQDFKHFYTSWIHLLQYRLRDHFRLLHSVPGSGTVAFVTQRSVGPGAVAAAVQFEEFPADEVQQAFQYSLDLVGIDRPADVAAAHVMYYVHTGRSQQARNTFRRYQSRVWGSGNGLAKVEKLL